MMIHKTEAEIALMKEAATLVSKSLTEVAKVLKPGMTTLEIDTICADFVKDHKAIPSFYNYRGYPHNVCTSVNDVVVHGFPNNIALKEGDIISVDMGVILNGWHGDHAYTFILGEVAEEYAWCVEEQNCIIYLFHGVLKDCACDWMDQVCM